MLRRIMNRIFHQNITFRQWGAVKQSVGQIGIYITAMTFINTAITLYATGWVQENVIDLRFFEFMGIMLGVVLLLLLFAWKVDMPSFFSSWNDQFWKHDNPLKKYLDAQFDALSKRLDKLEGKKNGKHS